MLSGRGFRLAVLSSVVLLWDACEPDSIGLHIGGNQWTPDSSAIPGSVEGGPQGR
jgi:hypothetical protein